MTKAIGQQTRAARQANWLVPCVLATATALIPSGLARAQDPPAEDPPPAEPPASEAPAEPPAAPPPVEAEAAPPADAPAAAAEAAPVAEEVPLPGDDAALAASADGELDEVVVTVDRRSKDLQKYSGTAAAFSERDLSRVGITNVRDLSAKVPGLQIGNQEGNTEVYIRGVGSDNNTELGDPAVSVHLDGIYLPRPRGMGAMFYDIARVEVNSGPQGTLRGRNAVGGSVNIVANAPKLGEYEANAQATFGTFALRQYQGMVNVPFGDTLALRVAAFSEVHDPHWENAGPIHDIKGPESIDSYSYRIQLKWQPTPRFNALAAFDYTAERGTGWLGANFQGPLTQTNDNGTPDDTSDDFPDPVDPEDIEDPRRIYNRGQQSAVDLKHWGTRLELNYDGGPVLVQALGSYRDMHFTQNNGGNAGVVYPGYGFSGDTPDNFGNAYWDQKSGSWVAELRLYAPDTSRFRWTIGGFFFDEQQDTFLGQTSDPAGGFGGGEFPMPETNGMSIAGYADATFDVAETFRVLGGARVTRETKDRFGGMWSLWTGFPQLPDGRGNPRFGTEGFQYWGTERTQLALPANHTVADRVSLFLDGIKSFGARDEVAQALCADPPAAAAGEEQQDRIRIGEDGHFECAFGVHPALGPNDFGITVTPQNNEVKDTFVDWRAGVEFDAGERNLLYGTVSTGHKVGGFNDTSGAGPDFVDTEFGSESVLAFELGSKNQFLDRRLRLNASAFYYRYSDQVFQQVVAVVEPDEDGMGGSNTAVRANATSSNIYGLDLDIVYALPAGLEAEVHALLMDARFGDEVIVNDGRIGFDVTEYEVDIGGNWLPRTSAVTLTYNLSQFIPTDAGIFDWIITGQFRSKHYMTVFNGEGNLLPEVNGNIPTDPANGMVRDSYATVEENPARLTDVVPAYNRIDIGAGWRHPDSRIAISGFVNNVFDTTYVTSIIATPGLNLRFFNPPRVAGVRFRVDW